MRRGLKRKSNLWNTHGKNRSPDDVVELQALQKTSMPQSIELSRLLELSHDLHVGRKRRVEWEEHVEAACRRRTEVAEPAQLDNAVAYSAQPPTPDSLKEDAVFQREVAEIQFLHASLNACGLRPRAPDAEHAFLHLMSAVSARSNKGHPVVSLEGTDFEWINGEDGQGNDVTKMPKETSNQRVAYEDSASGQEILLAQAMQRLHELLQDHQDLGCDGDNSDDNADEAEALKEMVREAMIEAETQELAEMLATWPDHVVASAPPPPRCLSSSSSSSPLRMRMSASPTPSASTACAKETPALAPEKSAQCNVTLFSLDETKAR